MRATLPLLEDTDFPPLLRGRVETLQVNLGYRCNQQCVHCHVNAGPRRKEEMSPETAAAVIAFLGRSAAETLDLTGGAPELNPSFRTLVQAARAMGRRVIDRCNLTVLEEPGHEGLAEFLAEHRVEITASLPCYLEKNVDQQRGAGVFAASLRALRRLNRLGYGAGAGLTLNLVYNPLGPMLPPPQPALEADYKTHLQERYQINFDRLYTITNMPIRRFGSMLVSTGQFARYMATLHEAFRPENLDTVMCRTTISVDWQGYAYDCDFNQMLGLPLRLPGRPQTHVRDLVSDALNGAPITVKDHCYGCTAGQGSSCGGALSGA